MSPELLDPAKFELSDGCSTKASDCYALGMVIYEVLSGRSPFDGCRTGTVVLKVLDGERPARPHGVEGAMFTDILWGLLERCWKPHPHDRPSVGDVLAHLEGVSRPSGDSNDRHSRELPVLQTRAGGTGITRVILQRRGKVMKNLRYNQPVAMSQIPRAIKSIRKGVKGSLETPTINPRRERCRWRFPRFWPYRNPPRTVFHVKKL